MSQGENDTSRTSNSRTPSSQSTNYLGISNAKLREELMRMFQHSDKPKLKKVSVNCRQFWWPLWYQGKVLVKCKDKDQCKECSLGMNCGGNLEGEYVDDGSTTSWSSSSQGSYDDESDHCENCWQFHLEENSPAEEPYSKDQESKESFIGCQGIDGPEWTIKSKTGTVRGVTNRVRAAVATFQHICPLSNQQKERGRVVVYVSSLGIIRTTFQKCLTVRAILSTLLVHFDERDLFTGRQHRAQLMERLDVDNVVLPQVFVEGQHLGNAQDIDRLNESGKLRQILKPYKRSNAVTPCTKCGGFKLLPCASCQGTKRSNRHRNSFTDLIAALKCTQCDDRGLVTCQVCVDTCEKCAAAAAT